MEAEQEREKQRVRELERDGKKITLDEYGGWGHMRQRILDSTQAAHPLL